MCGEPSARVAADGDADARVPAAQNVRGGKGLAETAASWPEGPSAPDPLEDCQDRDLVGRERPRSRGRVETTGIGSGDARRLLTWRPLTWPAATRRARTCCAEVRTKQLDGAPDAEEVESSLGEAEEQSRPEKHEKAGPIHAGSSLSTCPVRTAELICSPGSGEVRPLAARRQWVGHSRPEPMLRCAVARTSYLLHGCMVTSDLLLPAARPAPDGATRTTSLVVELGVVRPIPDDAPVGTVLATVEHDERAGTAFYTAVEDGGELLFRVHGVCDVEVDATASRLVCHLDPSADPELAAVYLEGAVLAFVLGMRGEPVLHASAVSCETFGGRAIALAGGAGAGKSTVTALLCASGCSLVTDDLLRLGFAAGSAVARGGCRELRLRQGAASVLDAFAAPRPALRTTADGRLALRLDGDDRESVELAAVVLPWPDRRLTRVELERLAPAEALVYLAQSPKLEGWRSRDVLAMQLAALTRLVTATPVLRARIPWASLPTIGAVGDLLDVLRVSIAREFPSAGPGGARPGRSTSRPG